MNIYFKIGDTLQIPNLSDYLNLNNQYFTIVDIISGGMGYCLKLKNDNVFYAAKTIYSDLLKDNDLKNRFIYEIKTWLTLSSINGIVEAYFVTLINDIPCIISEWMDNGNLRKYTNKKDKYLFFNNIIRIANSLNLVYNKYNIIHRDLKPENLLFDKNDKVHVADWGISKVITDHIVNNSLAETSDKINQDDVGKFIGTIQYAAPEQIKGLKNIDFRCDIYSLGCIMYEWETDSLPFNGKTLHELVTKHLYEKPKNYSNLFNKSNFGIEKIILKCLEKDPSNRYQSYESLIYDLKNIAKKYKVITFDNINDNHLTPIIGNNEIKKVLINSTKNKIGYGLVEQDEIKRFITEALHLSSIGEYNKVIEILRPFYIQTLFKETPDDPFVQTICINLSIAEKCIGNIENAIDIIRNIDFATIKPSEYYVNITQYYLILKMFDLAESFCIEGLKQYPNDQDIIGNLTLALSFQEKFDEAINYAKKRLDISKDINSLNALATVYINFAEKIKNTDFINAINFYKIAYKYLSEAKMINPRELTVRYNIVNILFKLKKYEDSNKEINEIISFNNGLIKSTDIFYIARNCLWISAFELGLKYIDKHIDKIPDDDETKIQIQRIRAIICLDGLSTKEAGRLFIETKSEKFLLNIINDRKNHHYYDFEYLAQILIWQNKLDNAIEILKKGIVFYPDYWRFYMSLSYIYLKQNKIDLSLEEAKTALKLAPCRESVHFRLSEIYKFKNDENNYRKHHEKGIEWKEIKNKLYNQPLDKLAVS